MTTRHTLPVGDVSRFRRRDTRNPTKVAEYGRRRQERFAIRMLGDRGVYLNETAADSKKLMSAIDTLINEIAAESRSLRRDMARKEVLEVLMRCRMALSGWTAVRLREHSQVDGSLISNSPEGPPAGTSRDEDTLDV
jgi:hypothetical protein